MPSLIGWGFIALIIFSIIIGNRILKRFRKIATISTNGCLTRAYVTLVVFCIGVFAFLIGYILITTLYSKVDALQNGDRYVATVVDHVTSEKKDDETGNYETYYQSVLEFTTTDGSTKRINADTSSPSADAIGHTFDIRYNKSTGNIVMFSGTTVIMIVALVLMAIAFIGAFVALIAYALGIDTSKLASFGKSFLLMFFLPFVMIAFDALLIYSLLYGNRVSLPITAILVFFIFVLSLSIVGYIKHLFTKDSELNDDFSDETSIDDEEENEDENEEENDEEEEKFTEPQPDEHKPYNKDESSHYNKKY